MGRFFKEGCRTAYGRPVDMDILGSGSTLGLRQQPCHRFHGEREFVGDLTGAVPFGEQEFGSPDQLFKRGHEKKIDGSYFMVLLICEPQTRHSPGSRKNRPHPVQRNFQTRFLASRC